MAFDFISEALKRRSEEGLRRQRAAVSAVDGALIQVNEKYYLNFSGNDYLGMRQALPVLQAWADGLSEFGAGSGASPLVTGYTTAHQRLEGYLAEQLQREAVILFNSGFAANQAVCQALLNADTHVYADKLIHASFVDGLQCSQARWKRFRHNDMSHLASLLASKECDTLVATEGVFSMDGDQPDFATLTDVTSAEHVWLMIDDAHGMGVLGETGMGSAQAYNLSQSQVPILMGTFGKAVGTGGAFVAGSQELIDYLVNFARHYVYSTSMPPAQAHATLASLKLIHSGGYRQKLLQNIEYFKACARQREFTLLPSDTAIQPLLVSDNDKALMLSEKLRALGIWVTAMRAPTVAKGTERLRITLSADHTESDISALCDAISVSMVEVA